MVSKLNAIAVGIIAAIAVAAVAAHVVMSDDDDSGSKEGTVYVGSAPSRLAVFGNADNDDDLDADDVEMIKRIIANGGWDSKANPYADTNADGVLDQKDADYLEKLLSVKGDESDKNNMYYTGSNGNTYSVSYPITGDYAVNMYYGCYDAMALGIYDRITASTDRVINYKEDMFPGCKNFTMVGTNYTFDSELLMKTGVKAVLGAGSQDRYDQLKEIGIDVLMIKGSGQSASGIDVISSIITLGTLCSCEEAAQKYAAYFDGVTAYIEENAKKLTQEYTYVMLYNPDSLVENTVDTKSSTGSMLGDVYAMSLLPMTDLIVSDNGSCPVIQTEDIMKKNPDFIVVSLVASLSALDDPAEVQKIFDEKFALYEKTEAYENGRIFGISYDSMGTTLGIGTLPLLCSMMWPDIFDEATAWNYFKESIDKFTELEYTDITKCGGLIVYGMS